MQGVGVASFGDRAPRRDQRLCGDLAPEDAGDDGGAAGAAEDVLLDPLEVEQVEQGLQCEVGHVRLSGSADRPVTAPSTWR